MLLDEKDSLRFLNRDNVREAIEQSTVNNLQNYCSILIFRKVLEARVMKWRI